MVYIRYDEVHGATNFAISGVLGEKDGLTLAGQLHEQRKAGLVLMLPVDGKAQAFNIERQAPTGVGDAELRNDRLRSHSVPIGV